MTSVILPQLRKKKLVQRGAMLFPNNSLFLLSIRWWFCIIMFAGPFSIFFHRLHPWYSRQFWSFYGLKTILLCLFHFRWYHMSQNTFFCFLFFFNLKVTYVALTLIAKVRDFLCSLKCNHAHLSTICKSYLMKVLKYLCQLPCYENKQFNNGSSNIKA